LLTPRCGEPPDFESCTARTGRRGLLEVPLPALLPAIASDSIEAERVRRKLAVNAEAGDAAAAAACDRGSTSASAETERTTVLGAKPRSGDTGGRTVALNTRLPRGDIVRGEPDLRVECSGDEGKDSSRTDDLVGEAAAAAAAAPVALLGDGMSPSRAQYACTSSRMTDSVTCNRCCSFAPEGTGMSPSPLGE